MVKKRYLIKVIIPIIALLVCGIVVLLQRNGVTEKYINAQAAHTEMAFSEPLSEDKECLILENPNDEVGSIYVTIMEKVLDEMRIGYDVKNVTKGGALSRLEEYQTVVITFMDWGVLDDEILTLFNWVRAGGRLMNTVTPVPNVSFGAVASKLGIAYGAESYEEITGFQLKNNCMIGAAEGDVFYYVSDTDEALKTSLNVSLNDKCEVYMVSENGKVPLIWKCSYEKGTFVIINEAIVEKYQRGFLCLAYSLLEDVCIYPVINASAFYLDDFPAPVPGGDSKYVKRDYGINSESFYSTVWWPTVLGWEKKYGIVHTGLIIEEYSDEVDGPFERNYSTSQFMTYGNMLLNNGGELGFHGYNHMPLCLKDVDENLQYGEYELWSSSESMKASLTELQQFSENLFPNVSFSVYVPPSNILSESGKEALIEACPDIKVIASTYLVDADNIAYVQEFEVEENGIIDTPRITSGCSIDDYQKISAMSELNFHYVQSHFMHPDDVLDEDRGASLGWEELSRRFEEYLDWLSASAPHIRNVTGSEMGQAVLVYDNLSLQRKLEDNVLNVKIGGFSKEAYFLMRINEGICVGADGCEYENITGNLYSVHALQDEIQIYLGD